MVKFIHDFSNNSFHFSKIHNHTQPIQFFSLQNNLYLPVVPMELFTLSFIFTQVMRCRKISFNDKFKHTYAPKEALFLFSFILFFFSRSASISCGSNL